MIDENIYYPIVPEHIVVHLGEPDDVYVNNVTVPFIDYIKNVASSEIYPSWPESAIRANVLAQVSFALNRIYTEYYKSKGYNFDITSLPSYDQTFVEGRDFFENISRIVDEIFNNYIVRGNNIEPLATRYCDGIKTQCNGLSQWGSYDLALEGYTPYNILKYYYGDDINIRTAPVMPNIESYPGRALILGDSSDDVRIIKRELNRISDNYPAIPKITKVNEFFDIETDTAVRSFQDIFNLESDGIIGKSTWYKIKLIYNSVKRLSELVSEGLNYEEVSKKFPRQLEVGNSGPEIKMVQYFLSIISYLDEDIPILEQNGNFDEDMVKTVIAFQNEYGLEPDGIIDRKTWNKIRDVYDDIIKSLPDDSNLSSDDLYPGRILSYQITGDDVSSLQKLLSRIYKKDNSFPDVKVTGTYDRATENAVRRIQKNNNLTVSGVVGPLTWDTIVKIANE